MVREVLQAVRWRACRRIKPESLGTLWELRAAVQVPVQPWLRPTHSMGLGTGSLSPIAKQSAAQRRGIRSPKHRQTALGVTIPIRCDVDMRIVVTGDRDWSCPDLAARILRRLVARYGRDIVIIPWQRAGC